MAEANTKTDNVVGVDLGGTKILAGVFDSSLENFGIAKLSTKSSGASTKSSNALPGACRMR